MVDRNGAPVSVGDRVRFRATVRDEWREGTVRAIRAETYYRPKRTIWAVLVDNGDPANADLRTNGFFLAGWVEDGDIEGLSTPGAARGGA